MNEVKSLQVLVIKLVSLLVGISSIGLLVSLQGKAIPYVLGLILGSAISVLLFMLLANTIVKASFMDPGKAQLYTGSQYIVRMSIMAVVLYISTQVSYLNVFATAVGIFMVKAVLYAIQLRDQRTKSSIKNL